MPNFRNSFIYFSLRAATTRTFLCVSVLRQTSFVLLQFLLPWNLLSQLPRSVMLRLAPMPASQKSDETLTIPAPPYACTQPPKEKPRSHFPATAPCGEREWRDHTCWSRAIGYNYRVTQMPGTRLTHQEHASLVRVPSFLMSVFTPRHTLTGAEDREPCRRTTSPTLGHSLGRTFAASKLTRAGTQIKSSTSHVDSPTASTCTRCFCSGWPYFQL